MKARIKEELLTKSGSINSNILRNNPNAPILTDVRAFTSFLPDDTGYPERVYCILNDITSKLTCSSETCDKPVKFYGMSKGYSTFCSSKCRANDKDQKQLRMDGIESKYGKGVTNVFQAEVIKEKSKKTVQEKYGVDNIMKLDEYKRVVDYSGIEHDIVDDYVIANMTLNELSAKYKIGKPKLKEILSANDVTVKSHGYVNNEVQAILNDRRELIARYKEHASVQPIADELGVTKVCVLGYMKRHGIPITPGWDLSKFYTKNAYERLNDAEWLKEQYKHYSTMTIASELDVSADTVAAYLRKAGIEVKPGTKISYEERKLVNFIESIYDGEVITNTKSVIPPFELDIYIPDVGLAIEVNGVYWHSENAGGKGRLYHHNKYEECRKRGIHLVQFWDFEVNKNLEVVKSYLMNKLAKTKRVFARKCVVRKLDTATERDFLENCHLQGYKASKFAYGLYDGDTLVSAMTFGTPRFIGSMDYDYELVRFAVQRGYSVPGGASKLLNAFLKDVGQVTVVSYSDCRYSQGNLYEALGFYMSNVSDPIMHYTRDYKTLEKRMGFNKSSLRAQYPDQYNPDETMWENMQRLGFDRVWGCKTYTWVLTNN